MCINFQPSVHWLVSCSILCEATFVIVKNMHEEEFCALIKYCLLKGKNTVDATSLLESEQEYQLSRIAMLN